MNTLSIDFEIAPVFDVFSRSTLEKGIKYAEKGYVLDYQIETSKDQILIESVVKGRLQEPYLSHILIEPQHNRFSSLCSCPVGTKCKHIVATLFTVQDEFSTKETQPTLDKNVNRGLDAWLTDLGTNLENNQLISNERLVYVLEHDQKQSSQSLLVKPGISKPLKRGGLSKPRKFDMHSSKTRAKLQPVDFGILGQLIASPYNKYYYGEENTFVLYEKLGAKILREMIETNRCYWKSINNAPLKLGEDRQALIEWSMLPDGTQTTKVTSDDLSSLYFMLNPIHYMDEVNNTIGQVNTSLPSDVALHFMLLPPVPAAEVSKFRKQLEEKSENIPGVPLPKTFNNLEKKNIEPIPQLTIYKDTVSISIDNPYEYEQTYSEPCLIAECNMIYEDTVVDMQDEHHYIQRTKDTSLVLYERNRESEEQYLKDLKANGIVSIDNHVPSRRYSSKAEDYRHTFMISETNNIDKILNFKNTIAPALQQKGWIIDSDVEELDYQFADIDSWYSQLDETSEYDWFSMELGVVVDEQAINLLPAIINAIKTNEFEGKENTIVTLLDGKKVAIPKERMDTITLIILQFCDPHRDKVDNELKISRSKAMLLPEIEKAFKATKLRWLGSNELIKLAEKLSNFKKIKQVKPPPTFKASLRPYQQEGVNWLQFLREYRLNGILADDMGLGKTLQTLALLAIEKQRKRLVAPSLIIAPTSVVSNWSREATKFLPSLRVLELQGHQRKEYYDEIMLNDVVLTSYALVVRDKDVLKKHHYYYLILDEAHYIKNKQAKVTQIVQQLTADHRLCLTGTPVENNLGELWSQFNFLMPGLLNAHRAFKERFQTPIEKQGHKPTQKLLNRLIKPFLLRRTKQSVLNDLPEKTEIIQTIELSQKQRDLYESVRLSMHKKVKDAIDSKGVERSQIVILDALLKLRQICCHPQLLKLPAAKGISSSTKLDTTLDMLSEMISSGRKILLFSQFTGMLTLIEEQLEKREQEYVKLTGSTRNRAKPIERFQSGEVPLFLISLKAGGLGLNLTTADTVIHYDPWWNPAAENQATDRAHRMGQKNPVFVYKLIATNTVEEKILSMQEKKKAIADALFKGSKSKTKLSKRDLEALFEQ